MREEHDVRDDDAHHGEPEDANGNGDSLAECVRARIRAFIDGRAGMGC